MVIKMTETTLNEIKIAIDKAKEIKNEIESINVKSPFSDISFEIDLDLNNTQESLGYQLESISEDFI